MVQFSTGIFLTMHAVVHLLYAGQSWKLFELRPGLMWPEGSWLFSHLPGERTLQALAAGSMLLAALAFLAANEHIRRRATAPRPPRLSPAKES